MRGSALLLGPDLMYSIDCTTCQQQQNTGMRLQGVRVGLPSVP